MGVTCATSTAMVERGSISPSSEWAELEWSQCHGAEVQVAKAG